MITVDREGNSALLQLPGGSWGLLVMLKLLLDPDIEKDINSALAVACDEPAGAAALAVWTSLDLNLPLFPLRDLPIRFFSAMRMFGKILDNILIPGFN